MKKETHPEYHSDVKAVCACGAKYIVGSTRKEISVEICSACHPFYTGNDKIIDTAGRVERFKKRRDVGTEKKASVKTKSEKKPAKKQ